VVKGVLVLSGHTRQLLSDELAFVGLYLPCTQPTHSSLLVVFLYCPAVHAVHTKVRSEAEYPYPALQRQLLWEVLELARVVALRGQPVQPSEAWV